MGSAKRPLCLSDMERIEYISAPALSPDGREAAYVRYVADVASGGFVPHIHLVSTSGGESRLLRAEPADQPAFAPDGALFFRAEARGGQQVFLCRNGEERQMTTLRHGVESYRLSPDGAKAAFTARLWPGEDALAFTPMAEDEHARWMRKQADEPIVVEELMYKFDESFGVVDGSFRRVGAVDIASGGQALYTPERTHCFMPAWSPDGVMMAYYSLPFPHHKATRAALNVMRSDGSGQAQLTGDMVRVDASTPPVFTPDGKLLYAAYGEDGLSLPYATPIAGGEASPFFLETQPCHGVGGCSVSRTACGIVRDRFAVDADGGLWFLSAEEGNDGVYHYPPRGGTARRVTTDAGSAHEFCAPKSGILLYTRGEPLMIGELFALDLAVGEDRRLTHSNLWLEQIELSRPRELWVDSTDGKCRVHGFVMPPVGAEEGVKYPAVLDVHGGPECGYGRDFWFEFQYLAARGLAVVWCDPRGSAGYGPDFMKGEYAWGKESMDDLLAFLDGAIDLGFIDGDRVGVTGGSFGGHMTNRLIGSTRRFKAAVTQRTLCNLATSYGTGDMGFVQGDKTFRNMLKMFKDRVNSRATTLSMVDSIDAPLLILHGTKDYRCSFEQAEQLFIAMKDRRPNVPVRLVAFPGENHGLTREGKLHFQQRHLGELAEWFRKYLKEA